MLVASSRRACETATRKHHIIGGGKRRLIAKTPTEVIKRTPLDKQEKEESSRGNVKEGGSSGAKDDGHHRSGGGSGGGGNEGGGGTKRPASGPPRSRWGNARDLRRGRGRERAEDSEADERDGSTGQHQEEEKMGKVMFLTKTQREELKVAQQRKQEKAEKRKSEQAHKRRREFLLQQDLAKRPHAESLRRDQRDWERTQSERRREDEDDDEEQPASRWGIVGQPTPSPSPSPAPPQQPTPKSDSPPGTSLEALDYMIARLKAANSSSRGSSSLNATPTVVTSADGAPYTHDTDSFLAKLDLLPVEVKKTNPLQQPAIHYKELEQIREHYLGINKEKKKIQKPSEKFRNIFNFEWDAAEDTARGDNNYLYQHRTEPQLLFGRGFRAGVDIREQRKHNNFYDELIKRRVSRGEKSESLLMVPKDKSQLLKQRDIEVGDPNKVHWSSKEPEEMSERDWRIFREDYEIYIKGGRVPPPMRDWHESELPWELLKAVKEVGYVKPTPIQMQAVPIALEQRDLIGIAETGSGKTAAFVLPMLTYVRNLPPLNDETSQDGPYALVLAPSRELALQIEEETKKFSAFCNCRAVGVVGGRNAETQAFELRRGAEIVIGTPGRIKDCLEKTYTVLNQCNYVVLDEADRMIDLGFEEIVNVILDQIPNTNLKSEDENMALQQELEAKAGHRQYRLTHMFSATMPPAVERMARKYLRSPAYISIGDPGAGKRSIEQRLEFMTEARKKNRLQEVLEGCETPCMVFTNQKKIADVLVKQLYKLGFRAAALHGGKAQETREASLAGFKDGEFDILVATDVAGRGIDVEGVRTVVNFDMPKDIEAYTHRIGRTGRMGKRGVAISFVTEDDSNVYYDLRQLLVSTNNIVPFELSQHPASKTKPGSLAAKAREEREAKQAAKEAEFRLGSTA